jgi:hypothetical protein
MKRICESHDKREFFFFLPVVLMMKKHSAVVVYDLMFLAYSKILIANNSALFTYLDSVISPMLLWEEN